MKILYIPSGYPRIYDYFDHVIETELMNKPFQSRRFHPNEPMEKLESIITTFKPTIALTLLGDSLPSQIIHCLKENGVKLAIWLTEDPFYLEKSLNVIPLFDYVFTIDQGSLKFYKAMYHQHVFHLPLGTDPTIFTPISVDDGHQTDILLVGYPYPSRVSLVKYLLTFSSHKITVIGKGWHNHLSKSMRRQANLFIIDGWLEPKDVALFYNGAKIVLNPHRSWDLLFNQNEHKILNESINNRTFDIAACGSFQLIEAMSDLRLFFTEEEMISYQNHEDCLSKINIYLADEQARNWIAENSKKKVLERHTFRNRMEEIQNIIEK